MNKMYIEVTFPKGQAIEGEDGKLYTSMIHSKHNKLGCMVEEWERLQKRRPTYLYTMHLFDGTHFLKMGDNFYRSEENGANPLVYWR
jgi:hypothetical protein